MNNTEKQWPSRQEVNSLRRELKALNKRRATMTDPEEKEAAKKQARELQDEYNAALQKLKEMANEYEWDNMGLEFMPPLKAADI
ncbi:MAG: hypothetical protein K5660_03370 [Paludibacteraceae bacterium]|nr:hypothetical protein [Paludibacteraceae bacterium]